jgi:peptide/nickel transport system ATP-binding protein
MSFLIKAEHVSYIIEKDKAIVKDISFELKKGEVLGIAGESGSGKTTLGKILAGLITPSEGKVIYNGPSGWEKTRVSPIQILFQNNGEILNPLRKIEDIVREALILRGVAGKDIDKEADIIFNSVQLEKGLRKRKGYELSGGEQQRSALARVLAAKPELLILDEPFSAQDPDSRFNFLNLFREINRDWGITMICISHGLKILKELCNDIMIMYRGEAVEQGNCALVFSKPANFYTRFLFKADSYELTPEELEEGNQFSQK